jgi:putative PIN family toxin of toxin-antitoxin system
MREEMTIIRRSTHMPPPVVVLDTNVFVAAGFNLRSASRKIVDAVKQGQVRMLWSDATRREIEHVMQRIPPLRTQNVTDLFRPEDRFTAATHPERFADIPDPDDRKFAALTHAAGAILISNDDHLLRQRNHSDLAVLTPGEFWRRQQRANQTQERA